MVRERQLRSVYATRARGIFAGRAKVFLSKMFAWLFAFGDVDVGRTTLWARNGVSFYLRSPDAMVQRVGGLAGRGRGAFALAGPFRVMPLIFCAARCLIRSISDQFA